MLNAENQSPFGEVSAFAEANSFKEGLQLMR
jgi:hypothetical protein